jgi:hypothetical protein
MARTRVRGATDWVDLKLRLRESLRGEIEHAASEHGVSMNQEVIDRLSRSFAGERVLDEALELAYGREAAALMQIIGRVMNDAGKFAGLSLTGTLEGALDWIRNPDAVEEVKLAIVEVLSAFQPKGFGHNVHSPLTATARGAPIQLAIGLARGALEAIKNPERGGTIAEWARPLRRKLGDLAPQLVVDDSTIAYAVTPPGPDRDAQLVTLGKNPRDEEER